MAVELCVLLVYIPTMFSARTLLKGFGACFSLACLFTTGAAQAELSEEEIKARIIQQSIAAYPGTCACPYQVTRSGSRCGRRSAYSKPGEVPLKFACQLTKP